MTPDHLGVPKPTAIRSFVSTLSVESERRAALSNGAVGAANVLATGAAVADMAAAPDGWVADPTAASVPVGGTGHWHSRPATAARWRSSGGAVATRLHVPTTAVS